MGQEGIATRFVEYCVRKNLKLFHLSGKGFCAHLELKTSSLKHKKKSVYHLQSNLYIKNKQVEHFTYGLSFIESVPKTNQVPAANQIFNFASL